MTFVVIIGGLVRFEKAIVGCCCVFCVAGSFDSSIGMDDLGLLACGEWA